MRKLIVGRIFASFLILCTLLAGTAGNVQARPPEPAKSAENTLASPTLVEPDPLVQAIIDQVDTEQIYHYLSGFAGEEPVWVDGAWYTITSRDSESGEPFLKAAHYLGESYAAQGLDVEYHTWNASHGPNIIGQYTGLTYPDEIYMIGGHLDDVGSGGGADDNASGPIAGLIAAEILSQFQWNCTLRYAGWSGEEYGLLGSAAYAQRSSQLGEEIIGYLNLDMIAWNTIGSNPTIYLTYNPSMPATLAFAQLFDDVVDTYNIDLVPQIGTNFSGSSDQASFWQYGYNSILGIEGADDFNPYYHGTGDTVAHTDPTYYTNYVKAALATFVHFIDQQHPECIIRSGMGTLDGHVRDTSDNGPIEGAQVTAEDSAGHFFGMTTDASGYYTKTLLADTYTLTAEAYGYEPVTINDVVVTTDTVTTVDIGLNPLPTHTVSGYVRELGTNLPLDATVSFLDAPVPPVNTDPDTGFYSVEVAEGTWQLQATAANHAPKTATVEVLGDVQQNFDLSLFCNVFADDMENGPNGWTAGGSPNTWAQVTTQSHSPSHSWTDSPSGNYPDNADNWVMSPVIDLSGYTGISLSFWHRYNTESGYDYANVEYSTDGGTTWQSVEQYDGTQNSWIQQQLDIPELDGAAEAAIRFHLTSDYYVTADGWYVDDVTLIGGGPGCIPDLAPTADFTSNSPVPLGEPVNFTNLTSGTPPMDYLWDFGDGAGTSTESDPSYTYASVGTYSVTLTATNEFGTDSVQHDVVVLPSEPDIEVSPLAFSATLDLGAVATQTLTIDNAGTSPLDYELTDKASWLSTNPISGTVLPGEQAIVDVVISAVGQPPNVYTTDLTVSSNDPDAPEITLPVTLTVLVPPNEVTFVYNDLEDVVKQDEEVWLIGCFTSGTTYPVTMTHDAAYDVFTATVFLGTRSYNYSYYVPSMGEPLAFDLLNSNDRVVDVAGPMIVVDYRNVLVTWAHLQDPTVVTTTVGLSTGPLSAEVGIPSVTEPEGEGRGIAAQLGWGTGDDPATWTWQNMAFAGDSPNGDVFASEFTPPATGVYTYGVRVDGNFAEGNPNRAWMPSDNTGQVIVIEPGPAPEIAVSPASIDIALGLNQTRVITGEIANTGSLTLTFEISETAGWLSLSLISGTVEPSGTLPLVFTIDTTGLPTGIYTTTILIDSNDPFHPQVAVEATLRVVEWKTFLPVITNNYPQP